MFLPSPLISKENSPAVIVSTDYRTADVFRRYGLEFCCSGKWPLQDACLTNDLDLDSLMNDLEKATRTIQLSNDLKYEEWPLNFLADYIINVHHQYIKNSLPSTLETLNRFLDGHRQKYPALEEIPRLVIRLQEQLQQQMQQEEEIFFPYIKQLSHAWQHSEPYAALLVRTLRKPLHQLTLQEQELVSCLVQVRAVTDCYVPPQGACLAHRVAMAKLKELDNDLAQHIYLEKEILFPRAIQIEKELLQ